MPGVNFAVLRQQLAMADVLRLGRYQCFHCGSRGNALEQWAAARGVSLHAAAIELCESLEIDVPWIQRA